MAVIAGSANVPLARSISAALGVKPCERIVQRFADGELHVDIKESVRGRWCPTSDMPVRIAARPARRYQAALHLPVVVLHKTRVSGSEVSLRSIIGDVTDRAPLIVDDMITTGATIEAAVKGLLEAVLPGRQPGSDDPDVIARLHRDESLEHLLAHA